MPTYQYACTACDHQLEAVQSFTDPALTECPACEGRLRKLFSSVGIVFKGSGFYRTDSRVDANASASEAGGTKENGTKENGGTKPKESTPASSGTSSGDSSSSGSSSSGSGSSGSSGSGSSGSSTSSSGSSPATPKAASAA